MTADAEMREEEEMKVMLQKLKEDSSYLPYFYQPFNLTESPDWRNPRYVEEVNLFILKDFRTCCPDYSSFNFPILPVINDEMKPCSYSELEKITDFKYESWIQMTQSGRLFRGTITEGSEKRSVIVKTWDLLLPLGRHDTYRPFQFCEEIELYETANAHPYLAKLSRYCCERRLAVVYDEEFTTVVSDVLLADGFGWDKRINVAIQLADLLAWLHEKKIGVGSVTASSIMIDKDEFKPLEANIKVFDFGSVYHRVSYDSEIRLKYLVGRGAPEINVQGWTMKSDVYIFGLLLWELITKTVFDHRGRNDAKFGRKCLVNECFEEVDDQTAIDITHLIVRCLDEHPGKRPTVKSVFDDLVKLRMGERVGGKRKRDENEAIIE